MDVEQTVTNGKNAISDGIKNYVYDVIIAIILVSIITVSLDAIGLTDLDHFSWLDFAVEWLPYFMAAILLNNTLYKKGAYKGKMTKLYLDVAIDYSNVVNNLTGQEITDLYPFVEAYNENALKELQTECLKKEGLTYEGFAEKYIVKNKIKDEQGIKYTVTEYKPLKEMTETEMINAGLNLEQIKTVKHAKRINVKGLSVNILLSNINAKDRTNIGSNEKELQTMFSIVSTLKFFFVTIIMALIVVKDIEQWGWAGAIIALFKVSYVFSKCFMSYFDGYNDITSKLKNHISRKTDILKMYLSNKPIKATIDVPEINEEFVPVVLIDNGEVLPVNDSK